MASSPQRDARAVLLTRQDWVYLLGLLVPFVVYNLALKATSLLSVPGPALILNLILSDIFFNLGYALFWIGILAAARRGLMRRAVVLLFHTATILVMLVSTCAYLYFQETGATLEYGTIAEWTTRFDEIEPGLQRVPLMVWLLLAIPLLYAILGLLPLTRAVGRRRGRSSTSTPALARDPFVNVVKTGVEEATAGTEAEEATTEDRATTETEGEEAATGEDNSAAVPGAGHPAAHARLAQTSR